METDTRVFKGMRSFSQIMSERDLESLVLRIGRNFEKFEAEATGEKSKKVFWLEQICRNFFTEEWNDPLKKRAVFKKVLGQTSQFTLSEIRAIFEAAIRWRKNPPALFWKLVGEKNLQIRKQLSTAPLEV